MIKKGDKNEIKKPERYRKNEVIWVKKSSVGVKSIILNISSKGLDQNSKVPLPELIFPAVLCVRVASAVQVIGVSVSVSASVSVSVRVRVSVSVSVSIRARVRISVSQSADRGWREQPRYLQ